MKKNDKKMQKRKKLWAEFVEGMENNEPQEVFDDRILDAYNKKVINKKEFIDLMKEIASIRASKTV